MSINPRYLATFLPALFALATPAIGQVLSPALKYHPITPCRVMDTRDPSQVFPYGPPLMPANQTRVLGLAGKCAFQIPSTARAFAVNLTLVPAGAAAPKVTLWPSGQAQPGVNAFNLHNADARIIANNAVVPADTGGNILINTTADTHAILDVNGYFSPQQEPDGLNFFPVSSCRLVDTRGLDSFYGANPPIGAPSIAANSTRTFALGAVTRCGPLPANLSAYALNVTAIPKTGSLGYITVYPGGGTQPLASLLNSLDGRILANGGIFKAGVNRDLTVYSTDAVDIVIDINGYFGPDANGLKLYTLNPCAAIVSGPLAAGQYAANLTGDCGVAIPSSAQAMAVNTTVTPNGSFAYLTLWQGGAAPMPITSLLNALDGKVTGNASIVKTFPVPQGPQVNVYLSNTVNALTVSATGFFAL